MKFLLFALCIVPLMSVDRGNFKKCDQIAFCRKNRSQKPGDLVYSVLPESVNVLPNVLNMQLKCNGQAGRLAVQLYVLEDNTLRLKIKHTDERRRRYEIPVGDVLLSDPVPLRIEVTQRDSSRVIVSTHNQCQVVVSLSPFIVDVVCSKELIVRLNSQSLMRFDAGQVKPRGFLNSVAAWITGWFVRSEDDDDARTSDSDSEDDKEETFKTHTDTKPFGATSVGMDIVLPNVKFVYGIPEHADSFTLKSTKETDPYRLYNLDVFEYELYNPMALYGSVPYLIAHNEQRTLGLFWHNAAETWVDIDHTTTGSVPSELGDLVNEMSDSAPQVNTHWFSESGVIDLFLLLGHGANDVFRQYSHLTGVTQLPPLFALAYHQSRWNYKDEKDVKEVNAGFDEHNIPLDVIWLDIEHTDGKRYFTWDKHSFSHPTEMIQNMSAVGRKMVTIVDPHIRRDDGYFVYKEGRDNDYLVLNKDSAPYEGWCWPGTSTWLDFVNPEVRHFWSNLFHVSRYQGSTSDLFIWNDMNEPSVFNGPEITMHKDALHYGGWEHRDIHNIYGLYVHQATTEGLLMRSNGTHRPFVLSRAFFAGSQRFGAVWTGDNTGSWDHLKITIPMILTLNLVGITFSGADVGGFFKNPEPELLTRWYQAAAFQPFFRAHAHLDTRRREPWLVPPVYQAAIRSAIITRYRLLPYWYWLFYDAEHTGLPVVRPLWVLFPNDPVTFGMDDQHTVGDALLVHPVTQSQLSSVTVYLPGSNETWYDFDTYEPHLGAQYVTVSVDINKIPVFLRAGHILPMRERIRRSSSLVADDPYTLLVALDAKGNSRGFLYHDDFYSLNYRKGQYVLQELVFIDFNTLTSRRLRETNFVTEAWIERIIVIGITRKPDHIILSALDNSSSELTSTFEPDTQVLTIRKPSVNILTNFMITLT